MRKIRYLALLVLTMLCGLNVTAQSDFNPDSPSDPGVASQKLILAASPSNGGQVSGSGKYIPGTTVTITASAAQDWKFVRWEKDGSLVSTDRNCRITKANATETFTAIFEFEPGSPADPIPSELLVYYNLAVKAGPGGKANGGGKYRTGTQVSLTAQCNEDFEFAGWVNERGEVVSTDIRFDYTKQQKHETLTAVFSFNPAGPNDPSTPVMSHFVNITATDGGTVSGGGRVTEGSATTLTAKSNEGYKFRGWYIGETLYSALATIDYTVGTESVTLEARFEFDPDSPDDPATAPNRPYSFYLMSAITYPGRNVKCEVRLNNEEPLCDMRFDLTFPEGMTPDMNSIETADELSAYKMAHKAAGTANAYTITLTGGTVQAGDRPIFSIPIAVPETTPIGTGYMMKINQVSVTQEDGTTSTGGTRNGRISIYRRGDTNGDGSITITDVTLAVEYMLDGNPKGGIREVADVNNNGEITITDVTTVVSLMLEEE